MYDVVIHLHCVVLYAAWRLFKCITDKLDSTQYQSCGKIHLWNEFTIEQEELNSVFVLPSRDSPN